MDLVVTGAYRSGTTLLDRLLHEHPSASVVPQPLPHLWIEAKRRFLASIGHDDPYPFGHLFLEERYRPDELVTFLDALRFDADEVAEVVASMRDYSGVMTPEVFEVAPELGGGSLLEIHHRALELLAAKLGRGAATVLGSKEVLIEELAPWVLANDVAVALVVRDPRGVLASLTGGNEWTGRLRPTLFALRTWRKSAAIALALRGRPGAMVVRYEALLGDPARLPTACWDVLGLAAPVGAATDAPTGWDGNTSFDAPPRTASEAAERAAATLGDEVSAYVEAVCWPELRALGYPVRTDEPDRAAITSFEERWTIDHGVVPADYTTQPAQRRAELDRIELLRAGTDDPDEQRRWFIHPDAYPLLRDAVQGAEVDGTAS